ncbi:MAG: hypothetical protein GX989_06705 [Firmicutes bacterium]|jgi:hypothetical protein|nr:hypothetical protein [Bacillota bacterium]
MKGIGSSVPNFPGSLRRRQLLLTEKNSVFDLNPPALNLSPGEYAKLVEEIKKRGNMS